MKYLILMLLVAPVLADDTHCLALNIYHEARSEPIEGQVAVALVTLNRVKSGVYPNNVCDVIKQYKQFSWYWDGKPDRPMEQVAWHMAQQLAKYMIKHPDTSVFDFTKGALWYYNPTIVGRPYWHDETKVITFSTRGHVFLSRLRM